MRVQKDYKGKSRRDAHFVWISQVKQCVILTCVLLARTRQNQHISRRRCRRSQPAGTLAAPRHDVRSSSAAPGSRYGPPSAPCAGVHPASAPLPVPTQATISSAPRRDEQELRDERFAMRLSLIFGVAMLIGKTAAYFMTHSAAIFSDAAESVIHVRKPGDRMPSTTRPISLKESSPCLCSRLEAKRRSER
jgi:hypothetical protein